MNSRIESGLIEDSASHRDKEWLVALPSGGATSQCYRMVRDGKVYFVKSLRQEFRRDEQYRQLYQKEYEVGQGVDSPYVVRYYDLEQLPDGECRLLMEYVDGETLADRLKTNPAYFREERNVRKMLMQLLEALQSLHRQSVVHLDLKPENIMLTQVNNDLKLLDLGFCYSDSFPFTPGRSPRFAAPEQMSASGKLDARTDIYAVGRLLEYLLNSVGASNQSWASRYQKMVNRSTAQNAEQRYQSVTEMLSELREPPRRRWFGIAALVSILVLAGCLGSYFHLGRKLHHLIYGYDFTYHTFYFDILSDEEGTCEVLGLIDPLDSLRNYDICIFTPARYHGKAYRLVSVADSAFFGLTSIRRVSLPSTLRRIGANAFSDCTNLELVSVPDSLTNIENDAFARCDSLASFHLPSHLIRVNHASFHRCALSSVTVPEGVEVIEQDAFVANKRLREVSLPSTLTTLQRGVFFGCSALEELEIPASVTYVGEYCLMDCPSLKRVINHALVPQSVTQLFDTDTDVTIYVPRQSLDAYRQAPYWRDLNVVPME